MYTMFPERFVEQARCFLEQIDPFATTVKVRGGTDTKLHHASPVLSELRARAG